MARGKLVIVFGPSGSGKNELIRHLRETMSGVEFPFSYTTREQRSSVESESYRFISSEDFKKRKEEGFFLEWAQFAENLYGTALGEVHDGLEKGSILVKEIEVQGIEQALTKLPRENIKLVFIDAGSWETLERRARARGSISDEALAKRRVRYGEEMAFVERIHPDIRISNPDGELETAKEAFVAAIREIKESAIG